MVEEKNNSTSFQEWTKHYEKEQEADRDKINEVASIVGSLGGQVSKLSANMETLIDNQKGLFNRVNRPWQWGVVMAIFLALFSMASMFGVMSNLIVAPINASLARVEAMHARDVERNLELHMWFRESLEARAVQDAALEANLAWLMKMEERMNRRIHRGLE